MIRAGVLLGLAAALGLTVVPPARALDCEPAGSVLEVRASISGSDLLTVSYTVLNRPGAGLRWISIGAGPREQTRLVPQQVPIDFGSLPFTAGGSGPRCWWGTGRPAAPPAGPGARPSGWPAGTA